jgi:hypothetical protein
MPAGTLTRKQLRYILDPHTLVRRSGKSAATSTCCTGACSASTGPTACGVSRPHPSKRWCGSTWEQQHRIQHDTRVSWPPPSSARWGPLADVGPRPLADVAQDAIALEDVHGDAPPSWTRVRRTGGPSRPARQRTEASLLTSCARKGAHVTHYGMFKPRRGASRGVVASADGRIGQDTRFPAVTGFAASGPMCVR